MRPISVRITVAAGLLLGAGCGTIKAPRDVGLALKPRAGAEEQVLRLVSARSIEEIDSGFEEILARKDREQIVERLLSGWGRHDSWYDLAVVHFIWNHWPSYYGRQEKLDPRPLMSAITSRISEQPSLLPEYFWYAQWQMNGLSFRWLCGACESPGPCCTIGGEEFPLLLLVAGATRDVQAIDFDRRGSTARAWGQAGLRFLAMRPFLRYDAKQVAYVIDYAAQREGRYLTADEQEGAAPPTPLPNWDSDVVPARPVKN